MQNRHYIITHDLGERIENLRVLGIKTPSAADPFFYDFHQELKSRITFMLPEIKVITFDMKELVDDLWIKAIHTQQSIKDAVIVSSCAEIANVRRGHTIEINRIVDEFGKIIGLGPRPGHCSIEHQLNAISELANGKNIVLVEDGVFTGSTIEYLVTEFKKRKVNVEALVAGISFPNARKSLREIFNGNLMITQNIDEPYEWMPDHDFIPFAPNCGRVYGGKFGKDILPYYTHDGLSYSIPYILPFSDPADWASIPKNHSVDFSIFCLKSALEMFSMMDKLNCRKITVHELLGSIPRISIPITKGSAQLPNSKIPITDFLSEAMQEVD
jgi:hypothetical protein